MGMADKTSRAALRCNVRYLYDPRWTVADGVAELLWIYRKYIYVCGYSIYTANNSKLFSTNAGIDNAFPVMTRLISTSAAQLPWGGFIYLLGYVVLVWCVCIGSWVLRLRREVRGG